jgi:PKD repeat protein
MKVIQFVFMILVIAGCGKHNSEEKTFFKPETYTIILKTESKEDGSNASQIPGEIDTIAIQKLRVPLKALAAFYSAMDGNLC